MPLYHKIDSVFHRDPQNNNKTFLVDQWTHPEFEYLSEFEWVWTEKIDGTNIRVIRDDQGNVSFGGRSENAQIPGRLANYLKDTFTKERLDQAFDPCFAVTLYGEGFGAGIRSGGNYDTGGEQRFILFDVSYEHEFGGTCWLERNSVEDIASKLGIPCVPEIGSGTLYEAMAKVVTGFTSRVGSQQAEGLVVRPTIELKNRFGSRVITKIKTCDFVQNGEVKASGVPTRVLALL